MKGAFAGSGVAVPTAVPALVGYTETARDGEGSLLHEPRPIPSTAEFRAYFGVAPEATYALATEAAAPCEPAAADTGGFSERDTRRRES